jgi:hypothetical protein
LANHAADSNHRFSLRGESHSSPMKSNLCYHVPDSGKTKQATSF